MIFFKENKILLFIFLSVSLNSFSQKLIIKDSKEKSVIPNVSVYNSQRSLTVLSDIEGHVDYSDFKKSDTLVFSHIAYEKFKIRIDKIPKSSSITIIYLNSNIQKLSEIILSVGRSKENKEKISKKVSLIIPKKTELDLPQTSADLL